MVVVFAALALLVVFVIAAVVIGREARRLGGKPPRPVFDFDEAVDWVCRHVSDDVAAVLSPDDVRQIINWHLEYFRSKGVSSNGHTPASEGPVVVGGAVSVLSTNCTVPKSAGANPSECCSKLAANRTSRGVPPE